MARSDEEYSDAASVDDLDENLEEEDEDEDDIVDSRTASSRRRDRDRGGKSRKKKKRKQHGGAEWEVARTWETLVEGADGTITATVDGLLEADKRKRLLKDTTPLQRGIIRHMILVLDLSFAMAEKDLRPTRYLLTLRYAQKFVQEFFEQNPISQLGIMGMKDGIAVQISEMSGNPTEHMLALHALRAEDPKGLPSLQNALEMARGSLYHTPSHGTREVIIILGALLSSDPGDIHQTITSLVADKVRVGIIGLAADVAICREICAKTNDGNDSSYGVAMDEKHLWDLLLDVTTPPVTYSQRYSSNSLLMMGFPSRTVEPFPSLCACHSKPVRGGYMCSRCGSKVCSLPAECPTCNLTLILSTHLARSYHHLFPLINWVEVPWKRASRSVSCFACGNPFPAVPPRDKWDMRDRSIKGMPVSSRYECTVCHHHFCIDCDVFAHEVVHNCPGCQSGKPLDVDSSSNSAAKPQPHTNGHSHSQPADNGDAMDTG
ncbi:hypothetical protein H109_03336 [Trichophyton interdigitale MR816]|uniref:General transcription and DNA repair factor IIH n=1 Tax=Trichophyton interdigitale (strain MR816) TaxID=1215338 RepID=A0A059JAW3_TRIIM|nr:hypothetical protein H101_04052 [Trichophyton interdigitale H6]KDB24808.1 hypothetical protein H109_03336 [Trichophyton interdigitale MR816]